MSVPMLSELQFAANLVLKYVLIWEFLHIISRFMGYPEGSGPAFYREECHTAGECYSNEGHTGKCSLIAER